TAVGRGSDGALCADCQLKLDARETQVSHSILERSSELIVDTVKVISGGLKVERNRRSVWIDGERCTRVRDWVVVSQLTIRICQRRGDVVRTHITAWVACVSRADMVTHKEGAAARC